MYAIRSYYAEGVMRIGLRAAPAREMFEVLSGIGQSAGREQQLLMGSVRTALGAGAVVGDDDDDGVAELSSPFEFVEDTASYNFV